MKRLLASCFGLGRLPVAPGTWGSLPPAIIFALMFKFGASTLSTLIVMAILALAGSFVCIKYAPIIITANGTTDPREVVADEFAGQAVTFLAIAFFDSETFTARQIWLTTLLGFFLFRLIDITKPWPIQKIEKLPAGWGVLADDLMAGIYAAIVLIIYISVWA